MGLRSTISVLTAGLGVGAATPARGDAPACRPAELFATDNTAVITDPGAGQLQNGLALFEMQADVLPRCHGECGLQK